MKIIGIVKGLLLFVYIHNKNKSLRFCKLSLKKIGWRFCLLLSFRVAQKWTETLHRLLVAQFFFRFLKLLFKWKYISRIGLFIRYIYIYHLALLCFSPLAEALQVRDVIYDHVNPHVLLFAAFCACKINPRKTNVSIFNGTGHRHLFFLI